MDISGTSRSLVFRLEGFLSLALRDDLLAEPLSDEEILLTQGALLG